MIELYNFILKIMQISNDFYEPDLYFIKLKYKLDSNKEFNKLYSKNLNKLLLFNSNEAEKLGFDKIIVSKYNKGIDQQNFKILMTEKGC